MPKFMKIRPVAAELFHADGQTDEANIRFRKHRPFPLHTQNHLTPFLRKIVIGSVNQIKPTKSPPG
jgi:hypothetical protein